MVTMDHLARNTLPWPADATMRYLNSAPLPETFTWPHRDGGDRPVRPVHHAVAGYGKWLRETPYFPGLFELVHDLLETAPVRLEASWLPEQLLSARHKHEAAEGPPSEYLAHKIRRLRRGVGQPTLF